VERIDQGPKTTPLPGWFSELGHLDQLLVVWEWRAQPTPWLVLRPMIDQEAIRGPRLPQPAS
jgi:hypothetical protein